MNKIGSNGNRTSKIMYEDKVLLNISNDEIDVNVYNCVRNSIKDTENEFIDMGCCYFDDRGKEFKGIDVMIRGDKAIDKISISYSNGVVVKLNDAINTLFMLEELLYYNNKPYTIYDTNISNDTIDMSGREKFFMENVNLPVIMMKEYCQKFGANEICIDDKKMMIEGVNTELISKNVDSIKYEDVKEIIKKELSRIRYVRLRIYKEIK